MLAVGMSAYWASRRPRTSGEPLHLHPDSPTASGGASGPCRRGTHARVGRLGRIGSAAAGAALAGVTAYDLAQRRHAILRNFPVVGHFRYLLEEVGPELRQYIVTSNDEERPFSRDQRRWVYASSKQEINTFGFGTDNDLETMPSTLVIKQSPFPAGPPAK